MEFKTFLLIPDIQSRPPPDQTAQELTRGGNNSGLQGARVFDTGGALLRLIFGLYRNLTPPFLASLARLPS